MVMERKEEEELSRRLGSDGKECQRIARSVEVDVRWATAGEFLLLVPWVACFR